MAHTTLPKSSDTDAAQASQQFQNVINDPLSVTMLVFGEGPDIDLVLTIVEKRAALMSSIRRVVSIPDPSVLSAEQQARYVIAGKAVVAVDGKHGNVATSLTAAQAKSRLLVEEAFDQAQSQLAS